MPYGISDLLNDLFSRFPVSIGPYCGTDFVIAVIDGVRLKTNMVLGYHNAMQKHKRRCNLGK